MNSSLTHLWSALFLTLVLAAGSSAETAAQPDTTRVDVTLEVEMAPGPNCFGWVFARWPNVEDGVSYVLHGWDPWFWGTPFDEAWNRNDDRFYAGQGQYITPGGGMHQMMLSGGGGGTDCSATAAALESWITDRFQLGSAEWYVEVITGDVEPPTAAFTWTVDENDPLKVQFDGSPSMDPDGQIASYWWDFGDGATSTSWKPAHTYAEAGTYTVTLQVWDFQNQSDETVQEVDVDPVDWRYVLSLEESSGSSTGKRAGPANDDLVEFDVGDTMLVKVTVENLGSVPIRDIRITNDEGGIEVQSALEALRYTEGRAPVIERLDPDETGAIVHAYEVVHSVQSFRVFVGQIEGTVDEPESGESRLVFEAVFSCSAPPKRPQTPDDEDSEGCASGAAKPPPLVVNSAEDRPRREDLEGCTTGKMVSVGGDDVPECTLRAALQTVLGDPAAASEIEFNIPGSSIPVIQIDSDLPVIDRSLSIDGSTQSGGSVRITGSGTGNGLSILTDDVSLNGLAVTSFSTGIRIEGGGNTVSDSFIGTDASMASGLGNLNGITIAGSSDENTIRRNVISGNQEVGIGLLGTDVTGTRILANTMGTTTAGAPLGNGESGIRCVGCMSSIIGGDGQDGNVIAAHAGSGIQLRAVASRNRIVGNFIGTNRQSADDASLGNGFYGIDGEGGAGPRTANEISNNVIVQNGLAGISLTAAIETIITNNFVGTDRTGSADLGNGGPGIRIAGGSKTAGMPQGNVVGGLGGGEGNIVAFNEGAGIDISGFQTRIEGNIVRQNASDGIVLVSDEAHVSGNVVTLNAVGIRLLGAVKSSVAGNHVGVDPEGTSGLGNRSHGILLTSAASENDVQLNTVAANGGSGICLIADQSSGKNQINLLRLNRITGNLVGIVSSGAISEILGNVLSGICIRNGERNRVENNTIVASGGAGILIDGSLSRLNEVLGNTIGTINGSTDQESARKGAPVPTDLINAGPGIHVDGAYGTRIGSAAAEQLIVTDGQEAILIQTQISDDTQKSQAQRWRVENNTMTVIGQIHQDACVAREKSAVRTMNVWNAVIGTPVTPNKASGFLHGLHFESSGDMEIAGNVLESNGTGIRVDGGDSFLIANNSLSGNCVGIGGDRAELELVGNLIRDSQGLSSGIHLEASGGAIVGNTVTGDAGHAIALMAGSDPVVTNNNVSGSAGFGLITDNDGSSIMARGNWWGDVSGPGGQGPGAGDAVSPGIDFSDWLPGPVVVSVSARSMVRAAEGIRDSVTVFLQHWGDPEGTLDISVGDDRGWLDEPTPFSVQLDAVTGGSAVIRFTPPHGSRGESNVIEVMATSGTDPDRSASATITVESTDAVGTAVEPDADAPADVPSSIALGANYPNPFNPLTTIPFSLTRSTHVRLGVYDILGRPVDLLVDGALDAGEHHAVFDASGLPSGMYFYRMIVDGRTHGGRMVLLK